MQERIRVIAEALYPDGEPFYSRLNDAVCIYPKGQDAFLFNPYENDADAFKVLIWLIGENKKLKRGGLYFNDLTANYAIGWLYGKEIKSFGKGKTLREAVSNAAYEILKGDV